MLLNTIKRVTVILFMLLIVSAQGCGREEEPVETAEPVRAFKITRKQEPAAPAVKPDEMRKEAVDAAKPVTPPAVQVAKPAEEVRPMPLVDKDAARAKQTVPSETAEAVTEKPAPKAVVPVKVMPAPKVAVRVTSTPGVMPAEPVQPLPPVAVVVKRYDPVGRIDPFSPLFGEKTTAEAPAVRKVKTVREARQAMLTPLEKLDISQLTLVGIVMTPLRKLAMAEDVTGKGYVMKKGTYVGVNSGRVMEIQKNVVVIEEEVEDFMGKIVVRKRELKLQKPLGEE